VLLELAADPTLRIGLVLGGGGVAGMAFHAGALLALHHDLGWDARQADVIVGTSAGSIVGALLRSGVAPEDLAAWATDAPPTQGGRKFRALMEHADRLVPLSRIPLPTLPGWVALGTFTHPSQLRAALTSMLPHGLSDQAPRLAIIDRLLDRWPTEPLWISAVRVGDGRLTWFGRSSAGAHTGPSMAVDIDGRREKVRPADAVAASCAIPVLARPVRIGRHRYVDGGVHSPTNADALAGEGLDLVVVLSPMGHAPGVNVRSPSRRAARRRLQHEVRTLRASGVAVQVISPDADTVRSMGWNMLERGNSGAVMRAAFLGTVQQLRPDVAAMLHRREVAEAV
jgi:NTE family protein